MRSLNCFLNLHNPSSRTMVLGFTQLLNDGKALPARNADNLIAICVPIV
jgi:hypothetical protein